MIEQRIFPRPDHLNLSNKDMILLEDLKEEIDALPKRKAYQTNFSSMDDLMCFLDDGRLGDYINNAQLLPALGITKSRFIEASPELFFYVNITKYFKKNQIDNSDAVRYFSNIFAIFVKEERRNQVYKNGKALRDLMSEQMVKYNLENVDRMSDMFSFMADHPEYKIECAQHMANNCMFITGMFPERFDKKNRRTLLSIGFYDGCGRMGYYMVAKICKHSLNYSEKSLSDFFEDLSSSYVKYRSALNEMSELMI